MSSQPVTKTLASSISKLMTEHPRTVGETYLEHQRTAFSFGTEMLKGGCACLVHGVLPFAFTKTGSNTIRRLYDAMVVNRQGARHGT